MPSFKAVSDLFEKAAGFLRRLGLRADGATLLGLAFTALAGLIIALGAFFAAAIVASVGGFFDLMDGRIARLDGGGTRPGAILDSTLDRSGDAFLFGGFVCWFSRAHEPVYAVLAFSALVGAFATSYVRARSEGLGQPCQVGFWERAERVVLVLIALVFGNVHLAIVYLGVLTHLTAVERLIYARHKMGVGGHAAADELSNAWIQTWILNEGGRRTAAYWVKAGLFAATAAVIRI